MALRRGAHARKRLRDRGAHCASANAEIARDLLLRLVQEVVRDDDGALTLLEPRQKSTHFITLQNVIQCAI